METVPGFARQTLAAFGALTITATLLFASFAPPAPADLDNTITAEVVA
jgi:hypothetical protein